MAAETVRLQNKKRKRALVLSGGGARGAYHVGVWKFLHEIDWKPDLICGTSVGAITAGAIGSGMTMEEMINFWRSIERGKIYRISLWRQFLHFITRGGFSPLMDTEPMKNLILERMDLRKIRRNRTEIIITAVNILRSKLKFFNNSVIDIEHIMASSAIPVLFPWQYIDGEPYWDGGIMANTPILPALERGVKEIIVVLLSPVGGARMTVPGSRRQAMERVFELSLIGSYEAFMSHLSFERKIKEQKGPLQHIIRRTLTLGDVKITTVAPRKMLGFSSMLNFSAHQADKLIQAGYSDARSQLADYFGLNEV